MGFLVCRLHKPIGGPATLGGPALAEHTLVDLQFREASHRGPPEQIGFGSLQRPREQLQLGERDIDVELFQQPDPAEGLTAAPGGLEHAQPARLSDMPDLDGHNPERHQQLAPLADVMEDGPVPALASQQPVFLVISCSPKRLTESAIPIAAPRPSVAHSLIPLFVNTPGPPLPSDGTYTMLGIRQGGTALIGAASSAAGSSVAERRRGRHQSSSLSSRDCVRITLATA